MVVAIIGILIALLLPAVQAAHESGRRSQCSNNLKQIAVAMQNYQAAFRCLPAGMTFPASDVDRLFWTFSLLPELELQTVYDRINRSVGFSGLTKGDPQNDNTFKTVIDVYRCPSDTPGVCFLAALTDPAGWARSNYVACFSPNGTLIEPGANFPYETGACFNNPAMNPAGINPAKQKAVFNCNVWRKMSQLSDGTSKTVVFSETIAGGDQTADPRGCWWQDWGMSYTHHRGPNSATADAMWSATDPATGNAFSGYCPPNPTAPCDYSAQCWSTEDYAARSQHPGGVVTGWADGSVHFISDAIDLAIWQAMASIAGGEVLPALEP